MRAKLLIEGGLVSEADVLSGARPKLAALVEHHRRAGHDTLTAYARAGADLGRSGAWVRRIIGRRDHVTVAARDWLNLDRLIARIEALARAKEENAARIQGEIDAIVEARGGHCSADARDDLGARCEKATREAGVIGGFND